MNRDEGGRASNALETGRGIVFVGGAMRSGTTLATRLLVSSGRTNPLLAESQYLGAQLGLVEQWRPQFATFLADYFGTPAAFDDFSREICLRFLGVVRQRFPDAQQLVLKHPETTRSFPLLAEWLPDARFVLMVRDPRDTIASMVAVGEKLAETGETGSLAALGRDMERLSSLYRSYYAPALRDTRPFGRRMLIVRYEDLVANRNDVVGELARFADVEIDVARLRDGSFWQERSHWAAQRGDSYAGSFWSPDWVKEMTDANVGRYRERLSAGEIAAIERHCADFAKLFRYW